MVLEKDVEDIQSRTPPNAWHLQVGHDICSDLQGAFDHEWLVTNGLGGYASGSLAGATTRSYHGLLVAALYPPTERTVLVTKTDEEVALPGGQTLKLGTNEYQDGTIDPQGYRYLTAFSLEYGNVPCFVYRLSETLTLEKRVWMEYGQNTTYVQYALHGTLDVQTGDGEPEDARDAAPGASLVLTLFPFCLSRDYHSSTQGATNWHFHVDGQGNRCLIRAYDGAPTYRLIAAPCASFAPTGFWYWHVWHRRDHERGLLDHEDVYQPGIFRLQLVPGDRQTLVLSAESDLDAHFGGPQHEQAAANAFMRHQRRTRQLLAVADCATEHLQAQDPTLARLIVAADQFIVARPDYRPMVATNQSRLLTRPLRLSPDRKTIIAGYPWFTDWGRDSMISLPGLLLSTGRYGEARGLLKAFAGIVHNGLIPNRFPDGREEPEYNTADATLWMFTALDRYLATTADWTLLKELFPVLCDIVQWHVRGTDYGIGVDPQDGLLHAGAAGVQLTWMDAKIDDWVVTPRRGKPVEINALWYNALTLMEAWSVRLSTDATLYSQLRTQVRQNFPARFWYEHGNYLYDVVDVDGVAGRNDASLRPNQLFAASLTHDLLSEAQTVSMFRHVTEHLLTPAGLRSLSPTDATYHSHFNGDRRQRDSAYHQGTVWQWLIGPYIDVHLRIHYDREAIMPLLQPLVQQLWSGCLGSISEVAEPEPPFTPVGCFAQAWSVAELLRCWLLAAG